MARSVQKKIDRSKRTYAAWYGRYILGSLLLVLGTIYLLNNFDLLPPNTTDQIWRLWPIFLIIPGIMMLTNALYKNKK